MRPVELFNSETEPVLQSEIEYGHWDVDESSPGINPMFWGCRDNGVPFGIPRLGQGDLVEIRWKLRETARIPDVGRWWMIRSIKPGCQSIGTTHLDYHLVRSPTEPVLIERHTRGNWEVHPAPGVWVACERIMSKSIDPSLWLDPGEVVEIEWHTAT